MIAVGAGNDLIALVDSDLTGALTVKGGHGDNIVSLDTVTVGGNTAITTGVGDDQIVLLDSGLTGSLTVNAGNGDNFVLLDSVTVDRAAG
ncbi:hypothetical protein G6F57_023301 [Rhizopus arrhizus]|nr:hypothetical protein G6F57_023301 [Rhizopus arrhizus]